MYSMNTIHRKGLSKTIIISLLLLSFICVTLYQLSLDGGSVMNNIKRMRINNNNYTELKIREILADTPYLWRKFEFAKNDTPSTRIEDQRLWIQRISKTKFIQDVPSKTILAQNNLQLYYSTGGTVKCPYAPIFESKCKLVSVISDTNQNNKYDKVAAVTIIRNGWIPKKDQEFEPLLPKHIRRIIYVLEPPHAAGEIFLGQNQAWLASYGRDSDIPIPYRRWAANGSQPRNFTQIEIDEFQSKKKTAAAVISNCDDVNNRLGFINELKKYIPVDVYGKCGQFKCPKGEECFKMLGANYKFYLAFENSNCFDYITEKFFVNGLQYNMLPVVMGAHPENYKVAAPPNSYIHVDDFKSPKALGEYLKLLDGNEDLYLEYFKWRGMGYITIDSLADFFCRVCGMLFYADFVSPPEWNSLKTVWKNVTKCLPRSQWYWR